MSSLFNTILYFPFYNAFILLIGNLPFFDAGVIVIIFTVIIKIILLPLSIKASRAQIEMKGAEKDLALIKQQYGHDKEEHSKKTIEYYKEKNINPFAGIFILLIQLPIIIGLYRVFLRSGLPKIDTTLLYSFVHAPASVNMMFLNVIDIAQKSIILAVIAGITTYIQMHLASKSTSTPSVSGGRTQQDIMKNMTNNMKYVFPILMAFIAYSISGVVALYLITSNVFAIGQEIYIKKKYHQTPPVVV